MRNNVIYFYGMIKDYLKVISGEGLAFFSEQDNSILFQRHPTSRTLSLKDTLSDVLSMLLARFSTIDSFSPALPGPLNSIQLVASRSCYLTHSNSLASSCGLHLGKECFQIRLLCYRLYYFINL